MWVQGVGQLQIGLFNFKTLHCFNYSNTDFPKVIKKKNPIYKILEHINNQRFNLNFNAAAKEQKKLSEFSILMYLLFEAHERTILSVTSSQCLSQW